MWKREKKIYGTALLLIGMGAVLFLFGGVEKEREKDKKIELSETMQKKRNQTTAQKKEKQEIKRAYLTFDDGPSDQTEKILDILKERKVKATFFVVGREGEKAKRIYRRILNEGNTLGMHSFSHDYDFIYSSLENYKADLEKLRTHLKSVTGVTPTVYRFPGGSSNSITKHNIQKYLSYLEEEGIQYFDWNALNDDAICFDSTPEILNEKVMKDARNTDYAMILMHDLQECESTVQALPELIDMLQEEGYELLPITDETKPVQHRKNRGK